MAQRNISFATIAAGLALLAAPGPAATAKPPSGSEPPPATMSIDALLARPGASPATKPPGRAPEAQPGSATETAPAPPLPSTEADAAAIPPGAPDDDYGLVAWCEGALAGHMALLPVVKPELDRMEQTGDAAKDAEMDDAQQAAGREYLALYARARQAADARGDGAPARADGLRRAGRAIWDPVRAADANARMWSWVMWELPARCETAARRLVAGTSESSDVIRRHTSDDAGPRTAPPTTNPAPAGDSPGRR